MFLMYFLFFKQKTAYDMRIIYWSSDVCSSDLGATARNCRFRQRDLRWPHELYGPLRNTLLQRLSRPTLPGRNTGPTMCNRRAIGSHTWADALLMAFANAARSNPTLIQQVCTGAEEANSRAGSHAELHPLLGAQHD